MKKTIYIIHGWTYSIEPWIAVVSILRTKGIERAREFTWGNTADRTVQIIRGLLQ